MKSLVSAVPLFVVACLSHVIALADCPLCQQADHTSTDCSDRRAAAMSERSSADTWKFLAETYQSDAFLCFEDTRIYYGKSCGCYECTIWEHIEAGEGYCQDGGEEIMQCEEEIDRGDDNIYFGDEESELNEKYHCYDDAYDEFHSALGAAKRACDRFEDAYDEFNEARAAMGLLPW